MPVSRVDFNGNTLIDLTNDTVTSDDLPIGVIAHNASGERIEGSVPRAQYIAGATLSEPGWYRVARKKMRENDAFIVDVQKFWNTNGATSCGALFSMLPTTTLCTITQLYDMTTSGATGVDAIRIVGDSYSLNQPFSIDVHYIGNTGNVVRVSITQLTVMQKDDWVIYRGIDNVVKISDEDVVNKPINLIEFKHVINGSWAAAATCDRNGNIIDEMYQTKSIPIYEAPTAADFDNAINNEFSKLTNPSSTKFIIHVGSVYSGLSIGYYDVTLTRIEDGKATLHMICVQEENNTPIVVIRSRNKVWGSFKFVQFA